jgi:TRAP-type C4-dicarboxylate transport system permease small subunit
MHALSRFYGKMLAILAGFGCLLLFLMMLIIVADILLRNIVIPGLPIGLSWSNEVSEFFLYVLTLSIAPWLLRNGQHIRVDILLKTIPPKMAWILEWMGDVIGLVCCLVFAWYGVKATYQSFISGAVNFKTLVTPEWWSLAPIPIVFILLSIEMTFRIWRLKNSEIGPRNDAVSSA